MDYQAKKDQRQEEYPPIQLEKMSDQQLEKMQETRLEPNAFGAQDQEILVGAPDQEILDLTTQAPMMGKTQSSHRLCNPSL